MTPPSTPSGPAGASPGPDAYRDAGSGVLRNRLGITDPNELEVAEADFSAVRLAGLQQRPLPGDYDLAHMQHFHERIFGDVYSWAGQLRTVMIAKGGTFCLPQHINSFAAEVFARLAAADHLRGRERETFIDGLTELLADLNALHPFGRATAVPNARSAPSSPGRPGTTCGGRRWTRARTSRPPAPHSLATTGRCAACSSDWSTAPTRPPPRPSHATPPASEPASAGGILAEDPLQDG